MRLLARRHSPTSLWERGWGLPVKGHHPAIIEARWNPPLNAIQRSLRHVDGVSAVGVQMGTWIAFFRGINVGGKNVLPMKQLVRELENLNVKNVRTYIQSGNAIFQSPKEIIATLADRIGKNIEKGHGFKPQVLILSAKQLEHAIALNPFPEAESEPKTLHLNFLASVPVAPDIESLNNVKTPSERFHLIDDIFYVHAPDGVARSKLAAGVEKFLGVSATGRNWRTVQKISEMVPRSLARH